MSPIPRRSVLFVPANNERATTKATTLTVDTIILDLEDSVLPDQKTAARESLLEVFKASDFGYRELLVRINGLGSRFWQDDLEAVLSSSVAGGNSVAGVVLPKVQSVDELIQIEAFMSKQKSTLPLWIMLETVKGVLDAQTICAFGAPLCGVILGTADLSKNLNVPDRQGLATAIGLCILAAKANSLMILDGVFMNIKDADGLAEECRHGKALGFDGKTLIHPAQIGITNRVFSPDIEEVERATAMIEAWQKNSLDGKGVCLFEDKLVEKLHIEQARKLLAYHACIENHSFQ